MNTLSIAVTLATCVLSWSLHAAPVLREMPPEQSASLLRNGGFEELADGRLSGWRAAPRGYQLAEGEGRDGSRAIVCRSEKGEGWFGASQTITLNQTAAGPIVVQGWSKSAGVSGGSDSDYSLYADLVCTDGTPVWGQVAAFRAGTHDWQFRRLVILPQKPIRTLTLNCLFRNHGGTVWFDDVSVQEVRAAGDALMFQGAVVNPVERAAGEGGSPSRTVESGDGLKLGLNRTGIASVHAGERTFADQWPAGFMVRDVVAGSGFHAFEAQGECQDLQLGLKMEARGIPNAIRIEGSISDKTQRDRAVTLAFAIPAGGQGWNWGDDIRSTRVISGKGEFANPVAVPCGATGTQSLYPIAAVWDNQTGLAIGLDMNHPAVYRAGYHAGLQRLFVAFDFALVPETKRFPSGADFAFVLFRFDARNGFRGAWEKYTEIFAEHFVVRSTEQGLWMPFTDVSRVPGWKDFGFRYHEGNNNVRWDDENGVLSFRYTEPMTWWMPMAPAIPRVMEEALRVRDELAKSDSGSRREMAEVSRFAAMHDEAGEPALLFRDTPWANGAVWSLNPNPWLEPDRPDPGSEANAAGRSGRLNAATVHWNPALKERLYGPSARGTLDGEYLDSLEGYVTADLNFRRSHFASTTVPLTFSQETRQPVLFKGLAVYEFTRWISEDVHAMGKLLFANGVPYRFAYLCPWLDVLGTETGWLRAGKYEPSSLETMDLWRTLSGGKPYLILMNTDYDQFTPDMVEKYFHRTLFYGMWPGFFSHNASENPYWLNPRWFERDRPLFRKFIPLIERVAEAGWRPVPHARCMNPEILIERYGPAKEKGLYLTLFNDTAETQTGMVSVDLKALGLPGNAAPNVLLGAEPERTQEGWKVAVPSSQAAVWEWAPARGSN